jgi:acyl-coenzyme A synthetase/AMP-(fatty) acid ligase
MKMTQTDRVSLWNTISAAGDLSGRFLWGADATIPLADLVGGSSLCGDGEALRGKSVLVATKDQLTAALALIELDGVARRIVLCPPDLPFDHIASVIASADVDAIVSDRAGFAEGTPVLRPLIAASPRIASADYDRSARFQTEWILFTSGTTGMPKMVAHTLASLAGIISGQSTTASPVIWSTFYDIRRYGGLQIFLRAMLTNGSLVLKGPLESTGGFLSRLCVRGVTHISGTPSHWRMALMSPLSDTFAPRYVRLSGEIADQAILDHLRSFYPRAEVVHAFATTEAGVAFEVGDGLAGFPVGLIQKSGAHAEMKVEDGSLRIRSTRTASRYLGDSGETLADPEGFVDTRDLLELRGERYYFAGRRDGIINVGGLKVHPEEVEGVINRHPDVQMSLVKTRKNPITGALVLADVVLTTAARAASERVREAEREILRLCRQMLPRYKVPVSIHFVDSIAVSPAGKLVRHYA